VTHKKPLTLSIVIPAYNEESYLKACLDSIAAQTVKPLEVIVVDNNSTDRTAEIAKSYPFVTLLREKKQGVAFARNTGFNAAKGDVIGRIDADTVLNQDWVAKVCCMISDKKYDAVTGSCAIYDLPLSSENYRVEHLFKGYLYKYQKDFPFLFGANMAIRKSAWEDVRAELCSTKSIFEDSDLAIHLYLSGHRIHYEPKLRASMSARRYDDKPSSFLRYISLQRTTYLRHGITTRGSKIAVAGYGLGYIVLGPMKRAYNPKTGRMSVVRLVFGHRPRPHPMG
jgi:glycosyltransferase involved in cell wall biosynthesis